MALRYRDTTSSRGVSRVTATGQRSKASLNNLLRDRPPYDLQKQYDTMHRVSVLRRRPVDKQRKYKRDVTTANLLQNNSKHMCHPF
jgi:hypothetical protein